MGKSTKNSNFQSETSLRFSKMLGFAQFIAPTPGEVFVGHGQEACLPSGLRVDKHSLMCEHIHIHVHIVPST